MSGIKFAQDFNVLAPKQQSIYPIPEGDWNRLKRLIEQIKPDRRFLSIISSVLFGISGSSVFSVISFAIIETKPNWIMPTCVAILVSSILLGVLTLALDLGTKSRTKLDCDDVIQDIKEIEARFAKQ